MPHLVENMAYTGVTPWHGLGQKLPANRPLEEWIVSAGMNWKINEAPVLFDCNILPDSSTLRLPLTREAQGRSFMLFIWEPFRAVLGPLLNLWADLEAFLPCIFRELCHL